MTIFRTLFSLRAWVLAWFVLALGVAVASPVVQPRAMEIVCSGTGTGATKILLHTSSGTLELGEHGSECPLCLVSGAPPAYLSSFSPVLMPLTHASALLFSSPVVAATAAPPPARGPPSPEPLLAT